VHCPARVLRSNIPVFLIPAELVTAMEGCGRIVAATGPCWYPVRPRRRGRPP